VRLASWTAGPHSASASILLLIGWWAVCTYTYPIVRYAPQLVPLAVSAWYYLKMHSSPLRKSARSTDTAGAEAQSAPKGINGRVIGGSSVILSSTSLADEERELTVHNSASISQTLAEIEELVDFFSNMFTFVLRPLKSLLDWSDPSTTLATLSVLLVTYPLYLLCFLPWEQLGLPKFGVVFLPAPGQLLTLAWRSAVRSMHFSAQLAGRGYGVLRNFLETKDLGATLLVHLDHFFERIAQHWAVIQPHAGRGLAFSTSLSQRTLSLLRFRSPSSASSSAFIIPLLPPYPLFSLTTSSMLLWIGTLVLTWTSPFAALLRHALWRSALVRYLSRKGLQLLTLGHWSYVDADGNDKMRHYSLLGSFGQTSHVAPTHIYGKLGQDPFEISGETLPAPQILKNSESEGEAGERALEERKVERHEDVVYQFSIYENQRWWVGLDWTAALLPQERPSW
jgi:Integral peroxisomal membrane peroxin